MLHFAFLIGTIKTFVPYIRKKVLLSLDPHEYLFLNTMIIAFLCSVYMIYHLFRNNHTLDNIMTKYRSLSYLEILFAFLISSITVISSIFILNMDKYYNTPLINSFLIKIISAVLLILTGIFIFEEKYNPQQMLGIFLGIVAVFLITKFKV